MARSPRPVRSRRHTRHRKHRRRFRTLRTERLEHRLVLAVVTWDAGGDGSSWNDPLNWSGDVLPTSADDVVISLPTSDPTIRLSSTDASVASLVTDEALRVESGRTLTVTGTADINAALTVDGGTLHSGSWDTADGSLSFTSNASTLDAVTLAQPLTITGGRVETTGGTTFPSAQLDGGSLGVAPGFSLPGNIDIQGTSASYIYVVGSGAATIPSGRTITIGSTATLYLGQSPDQVIGADRSDAWINVGTLETTSGTIHILAGTFINEPGAVVAGGTGNIYIQTRTTENRLGAVMRTVGGNLEIRPEKPYPVSFQNDGTVEVHNGTFDTNVGWNYSDTGTLILDNTATTFGGSVTVAGLGLRPTDTGRFVRTGGSFLFYGKLFLYADPTGQQLTTLTINNVTGDWNTSNAWFRNGTIAFADGRKLRYTGGQTVMQNITFPQELEVDGGAQVHIFPGTTFPSLRFVSGRIVYPYWYPDSVVIPPTTVVAGGSGAFVYTGGSSINAGTTVTVQSGARFEIGPVVNAGRVESNGGQLIIQGAWENTPTGVVDAQDSTTEFRVSRLKNDGLIWIRNGSVNFQGTLEAGAGTIRLDNTTTHLSATTTTAAIGFGTSRFQRTGGHLILWGTLDNLDAAGNPTTLRIDGSTGNILMNGGTIRSGSIEVDSNYWLGFNPVDNFLDDVDMLTDLEVVGGRVILVNGSTYPLARLDNATLMVDEATGLPADVVAIGGHAYVFAYGATDLVNPPGRVVSAENGGYLHLYDPSNLGGRRFVNRGTVETGSGRVYTWRFQNEPEGVLRAFGTGRIIHQQPPDNLVNETLTGGTWLAESGGLIDFPMDTRLKRNSANLILRGPTSRIQNAVIESDVLRELKTNESGGSITLADGRTWSPIDLENKGTLTVSASTLSVRGHFQNSGTVETRDGGTLSVTAFSGSELPLAQYADRPVDMSSFFHYYSQTAAMGPPDAKGLYPHSPWRFDSWAPSSQDGTIEYLTVDFVQPVYASGVTIRETSGNGFVSQIEVRNANTGVFSTVFAGVDPTPPGFNDFVVSFPQTAFPVDAVRITVDTNRALSEYEAIDAVRLDGMPLTNNDGIYRQTAGRTTVDTTLTVPAGFQLEGGVLKGAGDVIGSVTNTGGTVSPGASPGILDIQGDYTQGPQGRLEIEVAGRDPNVPEFDRLRITGTATLAGTVGVELLNGFQPAPGDQFSVVTSALRLGEFSDYDFPAPGGGGRRLGAAYGGTGLVLQNEVIPPLNLTAATTGAGSNSSLTMEQVVFDAVGNSYVVGTFQGTVDFDREHTVAGDTATSSGQDGFVASYDVQGKLRWLRLLDGTGSASATGAALQASAGGTALVIAGTFDSGITVGGTSVSGTSQNGFLLKLNNTGNLLDLVALPTGVVSTAQRVAMLPSGNAVVVGDFQGTMMTSPVTLTSAGQTDAYLLEYAFGTGVVRAARIGGAGADSAADVAVTPDGGVWIVGQYSDTTTGLAAVSSAGGTDAFALKLMPFGTGYTTAVAQSYGDAGDDEATAVAVSSDGRVHIGGNFRFSVDFDVAAETAFALHSSGDSDAFIVQLASDGAFQWARSIGGYRQDRLSDLTVDGAGHIYVTGEFRDRVDFDPLDGARLLETSSETTPEAFALKLNGSGEHLWSAQVGDLAGAVSSGRGIAVSEDGTVSLVGTFQQTIDVDPTDQVVPRSFTPGNASDTAGYAVLLAQKAVPKVQLVGLPDSIVDEGTSVAVGALVSDSDSSFFTYQWSVTRDGTVLATSNEPVVSFIAQQEGLYQIDLTVVDESGNRDSARSQIAARDARSQLQETAYSAGTRLLTGNSLGSVDAGDRFGAAISVEGDYVLIGSPGGNEAWLYDPSGTTAATQVKEYLSAPAGVSSSAEFGAAVLNLGDWLVVGAPQTATGGSVFVYAFDPSTGPLDGGTQNFSLVHTLTAPAPSSGDRFGAALARLGDLVLIGAPGRSTAAGSSVGEAYLFDIRSGALLTTYDNPTPNAGDEFGAALATEQGTLFVGAPGDDLRGTDRGIVHQIDPNEGTSIRVLAPSRAADGDRFGTAIAASGTTLLVSAGAAGVGGSAWLFDVDPESPQVGRELGSLTDPGGATIGFGTSLALKGTRALVGVIGAEVSGAASGAVYLFDVDPQSPSFGQSLDVIEPTSPAASDAFGTSVAFWKDAVLVGVPSTDAGALDTGAVERFQVAERLVRSAMSVVEGEIVTITGALTDPGLDDPHTLVIDWSDGTPLERVALTKGQRTFVVSHRYVDDGTSGTASDDVDIRVRLLDDTVDVLAAKPAADTLQRYRGTTLESLGAFVSAGSGGLDAPTAVAIGPDGDIYVSSGAAGSNPVLQFSGLDGSLVGTFLPAGVQGTTKAVDLTFGPDGNFYYLDNANNRVLRFDGRSGAFLDEFVTPGSGGLSDPRGLAFGNDGLLYVASFGTNSILRYDGTTGAFVDTFLSSLEGIASPSDLVFGEADDLFVLNMAPQPSVWRFDATTGDSLGLFVQPPLAGTQGYLLYGAGALFVSDPGGPLRRYPVDSSGAEGTVNTGEGAMAGLPPQVEAGTTVTIVNAAPDVTVESLGSGTAGEYRFAASVSDIGSLDTFTYAWSVTGGAIVGASDQSEVTISAGTSTFSVSLTVTDDDGGSQTTKTEVIVGTAGDDTLTITNPPADVDRTIVLGLEGNDVIDASAVSSASVELVGGAGNDTLTGGSGNDRLIGNTPGDYAAGGGDTGNDTLIAGPGDDVLDGGMGDDTMIGGPGNDTYIQVPGSSDVLIEDGGDGIDTIDYSLATFGIAFNLYETNVAQIVNPSAPPAEQHTVEIRGDFESMVGSSFSDVLRGNAFPNLLIGGSGDDVLYGGDQTNATVNDGNDTLVGGDGNDTLIAGAGDDVIYGGDQTDPNAPDGNDTLVGGSGNDTLIAGAGDDVIYGGDQTDPNAPDGNDTLVGGSGNDTLIAGAGDDVIYGGDQTDPNAPDGDDTLVGGTGNDTLIGGAGDDVIYGGDQTDPNAPDGDDTLVGGSGNDTLVAGAGDDVIYGGDQTDPNAPDGNDTLVGGNGNDTLIAGAGDDVIYGGDQTDPNAPDGNDTLIGGEGSDTLLGGAGDDVIYGGDQTDPAAPDSDDTLVGGAGNDTLIGGAGDDVIYGGDQTDPNAPDGNDTLQGGAGDDTLVGGAGDDVIFGGADDDRLSGEAGNDIFEGGSGTDQIVEIRDADMTMLPTTIVIAGESTEIHYDVESVMLVGGPSNNRLDASGFSGPAVLLGRDGDDVLLGTPSADHLEGGTGNDTLTGGEGDDILDGGPGSDVLDGGTGNDTYVQEPGGTDTFDDAAGIDTLDLGAALLPVTVDLATTAAQTVDSAGNVIQLKGTFENVRGTSFSDTLTGNNERNILAGGGGVDLLDGGAGADVIQASFTQVVYLDFDSTTGPGEKEYTIEERNAIEARLEELFGPPFTISFTQNRPSVGAYATITVNAGGEDENEVLAGGVAQELDWRNFDPGSIAAVNVNPFLGRRGQPAPSSDNYVAMTATIVAHEVGHLFGLKHTDAFGPIGGQPSTNLPYGIYSGLIEKSVSRNEIASGTDQGATAAPYPFSYGLRHSPVLMQPSTQAGNASPNAFLVPSGTVYDNGQAVATFQVDSNGSVQVVPIGNASPIDSATFDASSGLLTLNWNHRPTSSQVVIAYTYDAFRPGYRGPDDAMETSRHLMASPASVGSRVSDTLDQTYLSERSLIKLAFADAGSTQQEADLAQVTAPAGLGGVARDLGSLAPLAVPNLLPPGTVNYGKEFFVEAANVVGSIDLTAAGVSENDVYAFSGDQGEWVTIEILSSVLAHRLVDDIDAIVSLLDASGNPVDYFGLLARNDDGISSADPILIDVRLPATGTYYIVVDTFASSSVPDTDTGQYELFIYKYTVESSGRQGGTGDTLIGGPGPDVLIGGAGDDILRGDKQEDAFVGFTAFDISNRPPVAVDDALTTDENVTASINVLANDTDPDDGDDPTTFSLDSIDSVTVSGIGLSNLQTGSVRETSEGVIEFSPGSDFDELPVGATATVTVQYTMSDDEGLSSSAVLTITVRGVNDAPIVQNVSGSAEEDGAAVTISFVGDDVDRDDSGSTLAYAFVMTPSEGTVTNNGDGTFKFDPTGGFQDLADGETRTVTFSYQATDRHGGVSNAGTITVTVTGKNDVPVIERLESSAPKPCQASTNGTVTLSGKFLDPDVSNTPKVTVDWGDGSAVETLSNVQNDGTFSATHAYAGAGIYRIQVVVDDQRGGKAEATTKAAVQGVGVVGRTLYVIGTSGRDNVHIRHNVDQDRLVVRAKWNVPSGGNHHDEDDDNNTGTRKTFDARNIRRIRVYGCDGNDEVHLRTVNWTDSNRQPIPARIYGGRGNDDLRGAAGDDIIRGGGGNDHIHGGRGNDRLEGGNGNDWISGEQGDDVVEGGKGDDNLRGGGGNDIVLGGDGTDRIYGGAGRDLMIGGLGADRISGGRGEDLLISGKTDFDNDRSALDTILTFWAGTNDYATRIGQLNTGTGSLAGTGIALNDQTVHRDDNQDDLHGDEALDAFFYNFADAGTFDEAHDFRPGTNGNRERRFDID